MDVDLHADRHEKDGAEDIPHALERPLDLVAVRRLGHDDAKEKRAEGQRVARLLREDRQPKEEAGKPKGLELLVHGHAHALEQPRDEDEPDDPDHRDKRAQVQERGAHRGGVARPDAAELHHGLQERQHGDGDHVLEDRDPDRKLAGPLVVEAGLVQDLADDRGRGDHEHSGKEEALGGVPPEDGGEEPREVVHRGRAHEDGRHEREPQAPQSSQAQPEADREHEEDEAHLRERLDPDDV